MLVKDPHKQYFKNQVAELVVGLGCDSILLELDPKGYWLVFNQLIDQSDPVFKTLHMSPSEIWENLQSILKISGFHFAHYVI